MKNTINLFTEHKKTVKDGIVTVKKGVVVTYIVVRKRGGCVIHYREYEKGPLFDMLADGGIVIPKPKKGNKQ